MYGKKVANPNSPWSWLTLGNLHKVCKQAPFSISQIHSKLYRTPCEEITLDGHFVPARLLTSMNLWGLQRETSRWIQDSTSVRCLFSRCDKQLHVLGWMKGVWNLPQDCVFLYVSSTIVMAFSQTREFVWVDRSCFHKDEISIITIRTVRSELKKMHFAMLFFALFGCCFMFDGTEPNSLKHRELEQKPSLPRLPNDATIALKRRCMNWFSSKASRKVLDRCEFVALGYDRSWGTHLMRHFKDIPPRNLT